MKLSLLLLSLLLLVTTAVAQLDRGTRQADRAEAQTEKDMPPPIVQRPRLDYAKVQHEAAELSKIAQTIPSDVDQIAQGAFPKDVIEKLKQIEKLSKHLRSELNP